MSLVDELRRLAHAIALSGAPAPAPYDGNLIADAADRIEALEKALREIMAMRQGWPSAEIAREALDGAS